MELFTEYHTAVHRFTDGQATPASALAFAPLGFGVPWITQLLPFQRSARVTCTLELLMYEPTAVHTVADAQAMP